MSTAILIAPVKWAQRKDSLYVTIGLADVSDADVKLTQNKLVFTGKSGGKNYTLDLELVCIRNCLSKLLLNLFNH